VASQQLGGGRGGGGQGDAEESLARRLGAVEGGLQGKGCSNVPLYVMSWAGINCYGKGWNSKGLKAMGQLGLGWGGTEEGDSCRIGTVVILESKI